KSVVDSSHPLRHPVIVGIFSFERELKVLVQQAACERVLVRNETSIRAQLTQILVALRDQPQTNVGVRRTPRKLRLRCAKHGAHKIAVEKWTANRQLGLFQSQQAVMMPGG